MCTILGFGMADRRMCALVIMRRLFNDVKSEDVFKTFLPFNSFNSCLFFHCLSYFRFVVSYRHLAVRNIPFFCFINNCQNKHLGRFC